MKKRQNGGGYVSKNLVYFDATPEAVTSHFKPILFARDQVLKIIQHCGIFVKGDIPERDQVLVYPSKARIRILKECYRQWRKFHEDTYASTYAKKKQDPEEFKRRMLLLRKTPATTDEDVRHPLAESTDGSADSNADGGAGGSADGSADGGSTNGERQPEETCDVCHLPDHGRSLCPWAE